jgi:cellulose synthase/poly-beta-1,6-N-acetylglucosamine synthase-like glycosyltransferase
MLVLAFVIVIIALLAIALIVSYAPLFALAIALAVVVALVWGFAARRTRQVGSEHATAAEERRDAGAAARPSASAAPQSGEGGP